MIRVVAVDLDGTLLRTDGTVSARTLRAVAAGVARGIAVVPVTARAPQEVTAIAAALGATGTAICCLGAVVCDLADGTVHRAQPFPPAAAAELVATVRAVAPTVAFGWVGRIGAGREPGYPSRHVTTGFRVAPLRQQLAGDIWHLFVRDADRRPLPVARLRAAAAGLAEVTGYDHDPTICEFTAPGVDKGSGLWRWCAERGITADQVVAVGDTSADLPMLNWAGTSATVGNATPRIRAAVDHVLPDNDSDGVALLLEQAAAGALRPGAGASGVDDHFP